MADPLRVGRVNLMEYAHANSAGADSNAPRLTVAGNRLTLLFTRNSGATNVSLSAATFPSHTLIVQAADSLAGPLAELARSVKWRGDSAAHLRRCGG